MMDPTPELVAAVIAISSHDNHWVAHGTGAFSVEQILGLMDGFGNPEAGLAAGILRLVTGGRRLKPGFACRWRPGDQSQHWAGTAIIGSSRNATMC
jgi:hypothetical protein